MEISDYELSQLKMMEKFGPAISSSAVEKRELALQELVKVGYATMTRNSKGQIFYAITNEGTTYVVEQADKDKKDK